MATDKDDRCVNGRGNRSLKGKSESSRQWRGKREGQSGKPAASRWRRLLGDWERSGLSQAAFCRERGLSPQTFSGWKRELGRRDALRAPGSGRAEGRMGFVPVRVVGTRGRDGERFAGGLEVVLGNGRRIRVGAGVDAALLARVVAVLEGGPSC